MFKLITQDKEARTGTLKTKHGIVNTPFFMPIATKGTAKQVSHKELEELGTEALIANAFILYLKPGLEIIQQYKGIHKFMNWDKAVFTDSGGFQILSKAFLHKLDNKGVHFKDPFTGQKQYLTPEDVVKIEEKIGGDVIMTLDDVPHYGNDYEYMLQSMQRTHEWAKRCKEAHTKKHQLLFGICQGGTYKELREKSAKYINDLNFDGVALGGLAIGETKGLREDMIKTCCELISKEKPRYLMGVGSPEDIIEAISLGIDCFDSRFPTMNARHGGIFTSKGKINIEKKEYAKIDKPIDKNCECTVCENYTLGYLHHLYRTKEPIRDRYGNIHNLYFVQNLIKDIRTAINENRFEKLRKGFFKDYKLNEKKKTLFTYS